MAKPKEAVILDVTDTVGIEGDLLGKPAKAIVWRTDTGLQRITRVPRAGFTAAVADAAVRKELRELQELVDRKVTV